MSKEVLMVGSSTIQKLEDRISELESDNNLLSERYSDINKECLRLEKQNKSLEDKLAKTVKALKEIDNQGYWGASNDKDFLIKVLDEHKESARKTLEEIENNNEQNKGK